MGLLHDGEYFRAGLYIVLSVAVGLGAVWVGMALAERIYGSGAP